MTTLLVGGTGFLGSHVAARLAPRGSLAVLARSSSDCSVLPPGVDIRRGSLEEPLPLDGIDSLIYCASMGFGHIPLLIQSLEHSQIKRAVFVSTTAIYTSLPAPTRAVRIEAESAVQRSCLAWTILRPTMIYGTARDRNISRLLRALARWPLFPIPARGSLWQPIHVDDLADAVIAAFDAHATQEKSYNLAGREPLTFHELVRTAARAVRKKPLLLPIPLMALATVARLSRVVKPEQVLRLAEDKAFDTTDAQRDFAFSPRGFEDGVTQEAALLGLRT